MLTPVIAAITAFTISTQTDVAIKRVYVPIVVFGGELADLQDAHVSAVDAQDATKDQIEKTKDLVIAAGIAPVRIQTWTQQTDAFSARDASKKSVRIGIIMVDLGAPADARTTASALARVRAPNVQFGVNRYVEVDCAAVERRITSQLNARARAAAPKGATIRSLSRTTDPRTGTFDPIPLCPPDQRPVVRSSGRIAPAYFTDTFTKYVSASVEIAYTQPPVSQPPTPDTRSIFPYSTFGFGSPIIGQQNLGYVLHGGRFAATPAVSEISTPADAALVHYAYQDPEQYRSAVQNLQHFGFSPSDYVTYDSARELYVRLRPVTPEWWSKLDSIGGSRQGVYRFIKDCSPFQNYAHAVALNRSRNLAQAAADVMHVPLGPLVVETDYAGAANDATCGSDGSGDLHALIALAKSNAGATTDDSFYAYFWDNKYAAWALGPHAPAIASRSVVDRLSVVLKSDRPGQDVTGTATLAPDAYFYTGRDSSDFTTTVVASKADAPKNVALGNVVTDCDRAEERALANAIRVAQFDGPVRSFYAAPARFLSIACFSDAMIGHSYSSFPTVYNDSSPTGAAQVTETITVYL